MSWLLIYCILLFFTCFHKIQRTPNTNLYYIGNRKSSLGIVSFSILASTIGGSATLGMAGLVWQAGIPGFWWLGCGVIGLFVLGVFFARKIRSTRARTLPELCEKQLGSSFRKFSALIIVIAYIPIIGAQLSAQALLIASITNINYFFCLMFGLLILYLYTFIGGQNSVMKSDVWQFIILAFSLLVILFLCLNNPAAIISLKSTRFELTNNLFPLSRLFYFLLVLGSSFIIGPMIFGRLLSAKNQKIARKACFLSAFGLFLIAVIITAIGLSLNGIFPPATMAQNFKAEDILTFYIKNSLPDPFDIICLLGLFSAIISSADSCLFTAASILANDIFKMPSTRMCRLSMTFIAIAALFLSFMDKGILNLLFMANDIYVCGVVPPIFLALLFNHKHGISDKYLFTAMLGGSCMGAYGTLTNHNILSIWAIFFSISVYLFPLLCKNIWMESK